MKRLSLLLGALASLVLLAGCSSDGPAGEDSSVAETTADGGDAADGEDDEEDGAEAGDEVAGDEKAVKKKKKKKPPRTTSVTVTPVARGDLVLPVIAEGSIRARRATELRLEVAGRITRLRVEDGARVAKGQLLAQVDDREYRLALEEAESRYLKALGQLAVEEDGYEGSEKAERHLSERTEELNRLERRGELSRDERLDQDLALGMAAVRKGAYRRELLEVRSGLAAARADAARLKLALERTAIRAPFDGVISGLTLTEGERVQLGDHLCRLVDDVEVEAEVFVLESDLGSVTVGKPARLTIPSLGETLAVTVDVVRPEIDAASRTCGVLMRLESDDGRLKPGMFVRAAIAGKTFSDRIVVPSEALLTRDGRPMVFKVEDDKAKWVYVELGERNDQLVEIASVYQGGPLDPGTLVVVDNHLTLTHDAAIKVKKRQAIVDPWVATAAE